MKYIIILISWIVLLSACEERFIPDVPNEQPVIVEGAISMGENVLPPYVILSRGSAFFGTNNLSEIFSNQITDAEVRVIYKDESYELPLLCIQDLDEAFQDLVFMQLGLPPGVDADICVYIDLLNTIPIIDNEAYHLEIELANGNLISGTTTIPSAVPLDSLAFTPPPGNAQADTMARLLGFISDPIEQNFYRYAVGINGGAVLAGSGSVTDDAFFNGLSFQFPLSKPTNIQNDNVEDPELFGLYKRGDTVTLNWQTIDYDTYQFWNTFEFSLVNQGPFSTYTRVTSNVDNAVGLWGGYRSIQYNIIVPEE